MKIRTAVALCSLAVVILSCAAAKPDITRIEDSNGPLGKPRGIMPGRVVWAHNPNSTNENCTNTFGRPGIRDDDDGYWMQHNINRSAVEQMLEETVMKVTGQATVAGAWDALFTSFNKRKGRSAQGYREGEKIFIKINATSAWAGNDILSNVAPDFTIVENDFYGILETSPQLILALLKQLVFNAGVPQTCIFVGDPSRSIYTHCLDMWRADFPNVNYVDKFGLKGNNRIRTAYTGKDVLFYSDKGKVLNEDSAKSSRSDRICSQAYDADYLIDVAALKAHETAGVTLCSKNLFGLLPSHRVSGLHKGLMITEDRGPIDRTAYRMYRSVVDFMGHGKLGENTVLSIIDGLFGSEGSILPPCKWKSTPFNGDWPSSILASQDMVALESVCLDILRKEFTVANHPLSEKRSGFPHPRNDYYLPTLQPGIDDYLHQAADSSWWPDSVRYDPENDGTAIPSLGTHEHWNNPVDMQYSRNLGKDKGIELIRIESKYATRTIPVPPAGNPPVIDGSEQDACWTGVPWNAIDQNWIPYGVWLDPEDFSGRYKVVWTPEQLYILTEITDDTLVTDNPKPVDNYPSWDCVEIFIDEDNSGGDHTYNHNAFAYHAGYDRHVVDMDGEQPKLFDRFLKVATGKNKGKLIWEFAIPLYDSTFTYDKAVNSIATLKTGKIIGFSIAYCDNDNPSEEPKTRDNFWGSVWVPPKDANESWRNASLFGKLELKPSR